MANPYFTGSPIPDMSGNVLRAAQLGQQNRQFHEELYAQNPHLKPWGNAEYLKTLSKMKMAGLPIDKLSFISNDLREMAGNPDMNRGDIADAIEMKWPEIYSQTSDEIRKEVMSLSDKAAAMNPADPKYKEIAGQIEKLGILQSSMDG
jgi:hypothetical protein